MFPLTQESLIKASKSTLRRWTICEPLPYITLIHPVADGWLSLRELDGECPEPPLFIKYGDQVFTLELCASVRRSLDEVPTAVNPKGFNLESPIDASLGSPRTIRTTTESLLDTQSNLTALTCEVRFRSGLSFPDELLLILFLQLTCSDLSSEEEWDGFLRDADALTGIAYRSASSAISSVQIDGLKIDEGTTWR